MKESQRKRVRAGRRAKRVRARMLGVAEKPRLSVFRSHKHIHAQLIDDVAGRVVSSASSLGKTGGSTQVSQELENSEKNSDSVPKFSKKIKAASLVGAAIAKKAKEAGIETCVFDRGRYRYHGRIKALAEGARKEGLRF